MSGITDEAAIETHDLMQQAEEQEARVCWQPHFISSLAERDSFTPRTIQSYSNRRELGKRLSRATRPRTLKRPKGATRSPRSIRSRRLCIYPKIMGDGEANKPRAV